MAAGLSELTEEEVNDIPREAMKAVGSDHSRPIDIAHSLLPSEFTNLKIHKHTYCIYILIHILYVLYVFS